MTNNRRARPVGIGTGYLSLMMIFVVLCLTILAALSFSAAQTERKYSEKSAEYTRLYYAAEAEATAVFAQIAELAREYDDYTDFALSEELSAIEGVTCEPLMGGTAISWSTPINGRQAIFSRVELTAKGIEITDQRTVSIGENEEPPLNVWLGEQEIDYGR